MKKIYIKKTRVNEDDANANSQQANAQQSGNSQAGGQSDNGNTTANYDQEFLALQAQANDLKTDRDKRIAELNNQIAKVNFDYTTKMKPIKDRVENMNKRLTSAGLPTKVLSESYSYEKQYSGFMIGDLRFSKKLFESRKPESLVEELVKLLYSAIQSADASYTPVSYEVAQRVLRSRARDIKTFLYNKKDWASEIVPKNHWDELSEYIRNGFKNSNRTEFHYQDNELNRIMDKLEERLRKSDNFFWIFGNELNKK